MISSILLAAGLSSRMGRSKPLLPFGDRTVIEHIVSVLLECPQGEILVITGHYGNEVESKLTGYPARVVNNPNYEEGEMLSSVQTGLRSASQDAEAALIVLGDQPSLEAKTFELLASCYQRDCGEIIFPSYKMRRGHPILIGRKHWAGIVSLGEEQSLREYFRGVSEDIYHTVVDTPSVLRDMDTPADYRRELANYLGRSQT